MSTDAFLHEEDQAAILQLDQGRENQEQRPKQQHRRRGAKQIHAALEKTLRQAGEIVAHLKQQQILAEKITGAEAEQGQASQRRHDGDADTTPSDPFIAGI